MQPQLLIGILAFLTTVPALPQNPWDIHPSTGTNTAIASENLYMMGKVASSPGDGQGIYYCTENDFKGDCHWLNTIGDNTWGHDVGKCFAIYGNTQAVGPDQGVFCGMFQSYDACQWYSGNVAHDKSPPSEWTSGNVVALQYPGVTNLGAVWWHADDRGAWVYCFKTDSGNNQHQAVWTAE